MHPHPLIHTEMARQRQLDLLRDARSSTIDTRELRVKRHSLRMGFRLSLWPPRVFRRATLLTE
jgi:hypothetical protein